MTSFFHFVIYLDGKISLVHAWCIHLSHKYTNIYQPMLKFTTQYGFHALLFLK